MLNLEAKNQQMLSFFENIIRFLAFYIKNNVFSQKMQTWDGFSRDLIIIKN